jgi:hypothetical protein
LSDSKKRSRYDSGYDLEDLDGGGHSGFGGDIDPDQVAPLSRNGLDEEQKIRWGGYDNVTFIAKVRSTKDLNLNLKIKAILL